MISDFLQRLLFVKQFDIGDGNIEVLNSHQMLVPLEFVMEMQELNPDKFYRFMFYSVKEFFEGVGKQFGDDTFKKSEDLFGLFGLGRLNIVDFDPEKQRALVQVHETPLLSKYSKKHHICSITTGVLAGMFTYLLKKDVHAIVNKCMARGDNYCEFIVK